MNVLLVGEIYSENLGDPLLCGVVENVIKQKYQDANIYKLDMSGRDNSSNSHFKRRRKFWGVRILTKMLGKTKRRWKIFAIFRLIDEDKNRFLNVLDLLDNIISQEKIDFVVFAGGSIFMDYFAATIYCIVKRFKNKKTNIIFHACGMSNLSEDAIIVLKEALKQKNIVAISLRDSIDRFKHIFDKIAVEETYDTALQCCRFYHQADKIEAFLGVGIIANDGYFAEQRKLVQELINKKIDFKIFVNGARYDYNYAIKILDNLNIPMDNKEKLLLDKADTPQKLIEQITSFRYIISFRLHSQIIATSYGIPSFGYVWDDKIKEFYRKIGLKDNCSNEYVNVDSIIKKLENEEKIREHLKEKATRQGEMSQNYLLNSIEMETNGRYTR